MPFLKKNSGILIIGIITIVGSANLTLANVASVRLQAYFNEQGMPMVTVPMSWGEQSFIVDTGSDFALHINEDFINKMDSGIRENGSVRSIDVGGRVTQNRSFEISLIEIGDVRFEGLQAVELKPWGVVASGEVLELSEEADDMVLGRPFFSGKLALFDYRAGFIEVASSVLKEDYLDDSRFDPLRTIKTPEGIVLEVTTLNDVLHLIVDTASPVSIIRKDRIGDAKEIPCSELLEGLSNQGCKAISFPLSEGTSDREIKAMVIDSDFGGLEADGILGSDFLLQRRLLIDFPNNQVYSD